jgi:hypothetical protein
MTPELRKIGRYEIVGELGHGGMGVVYDAIDPKIRRAVAIKILNLKELAEADEAQVLKDRLLREARSAGMLSHPGIVTVYDVDEDGEIPFIAMERVKGPTLGAMLRAKGRLPVEPALDILFQTAAALDYAHGNGVVHRDIKPANIMLQDGKIVKVADFGIARQLFASTQTMEGRIAGTWEYMSPEQCQGRETDGRSDQFSLATVAFEMLTGSSPFKADSPASVYHKLVVGTRPSARALNPGLPKVLDDVLGRAWSQDTGQRYPSCAAFAAALRSAATGVPEPEAPTIASTTTTATITHYDQHAPVTAARTLPARIFRKAIGKKCAKPPAQCPQAGVVKETSARMCESCHSELVLATKWNMGAVVICALLLAVPAGAVGVRALLRSPAVVASYKPVVQYALQDGAGDPMIVPGDYVFHSGDRFRLLVKSGNPAYIYVFYQNRPDGHLSLLFPGENRPVLSSGNTASIPSDSEWIRLDTTPGAEHFFVVAASTALYSFRDIASGEVLKTRLNQVVEAALKRGDRGDSASLTELVVQHEQ